MLSFERILVPTDFSEHSLMALDYAVALAEKFDASLKIVYVDQPSLKVSDMAWIGVDQRSMDEDHRTTARRALEKIVLDRIPLEMPADAQLLAGDPVDEIIRFANESDVDLIMVATHGRSGVSHVLMGSTAEAIVRKASCPVLTVKNPMDETDSAEGTNN